MRVGHTEVCCQSSNRRRAFVAIVAGSIDPSPYTSILVNILFCRFREKKTHVATTSGVCPTPPIDRFSIVVPVAFEFTVDPSRSPFERVDFAIDF